VVVELSFSTSLSSIGEAAGVVDPRLISGEHAGAIFFVN
jgi:hypothetical protein